MTRLETSIHLEATPEELFDTSLAVHQIPGYPE